MVVTSERGAAQIYFSDFFDVSPALLEDHGAFDISLVNDLPLFIDPFLLFNSRKAEYRQLHDDIIRYLRFLRDKSLGQALHPGLIGAWYRFGEVRQNWLGFSRVATTAAASAPTLPGRSTRTLARCSRTSARSG